jgi:hypothetical protein
MLGPFLERTATTDVDPLDLQLDRLGAAPARARRRFPWQMRLAISWSTGSLPAVLLLLLGIAFGPEGLGLLTPGVLALIDPAVPVALAAVGVVVGLSLPLRRPHEARLGAAASVESLATGAIVTGGLLFIAPAIAEPGVLHTWVLALAAGICAATSSAMPSSAAGARTPLQRIKDLDARIPIVAGALLLALPPGVSVLDGLLLALQACAVALVVAGAGWLLLNDTTSETEQRVFAVAALLLVGGVADYLSLSALLSGVLAGAFWQLAGGAARDAIERDIGYMQHPLVVILLLVAGAQVVFSADAAAIAVAYVLFRTAGKLLGGWLATTVARISVPGIGLFLISPGIFGVAFAMNVVRAFGSDISPLVAIVVIGTVGSQLVSAFGQPRGEEQL